MARPTKAQKAWVDGSITNIPVQPRKESWWIAVKREDWNATVRENERGMELGRFGHRTASDKPFS